MIQEKLLTNVELAEALGTGFKPRTVKTLRQAHKIPVVKVGARILRYRLSAVLAALEIRLAAGAVVELTRNVGSPVTKLAGLNHIVCITDNNTHDRRTATATAASSL